MIKHLIVALAVVATSVVAVAEEPKKPSPDEMMAMYMLELFFAMPEGREMLVAETVYRRAKS